MSAPKPTRSQGDLAEMLEMLLDKGVVINADIAVSIGDTELLGIELRAAVASFETAAQYGLEFPTGTDMERVEEAAGISPDESRSLDTRSESEQMDELPGEAGASVSNTAPQEEE
ncbi:gas vesicle protein [Haloferax mediterranei ATCC 33500]|uniref:Gas vesicle protein J n=2 Tax=Haloferax mediterranei (strain ATCC 33500 / DSM 1411 / JCM 8866 / NBRC 14739 / NCIMB 2177 / R-4) TaxID=523841 RepID=GVPJ_HALMT|nr:gas vesicle protein [Haloferax mediterranei]Q02235.1 RecName: Full=Gas vesicle protein J; Short=GvpJ [Haloferax mediterranei ATCC 33500]AFK19409.1 gas-vesicle operon protein gvpJ [Haloferax mediterranei ATCC 33500]AHZ21241.1 gas vesicle protein GvpJ [Haloferax mediterranei ATCC 33500]EMA04402.1 gas-vesicle operon protein gvpJ [Haloferax mediterranei ATCC 33500]MDX5989512.1 gas vesicle protein [Haloferax mediterranei ATCC 33500]QCQ75871.1 gas vesicle protein [Haloferax mediterranei ATCC 335